MGALDNPAAGSLLRWRGPTVVPSSHRLLCLKARAPGSPGLPPPLTLPAPSCLQPLFLFASHFSPKPPAAAPMAAARALSVHCVSLTTSHRACEFVCACDDAPCGAQRRAEIAAAV